MPHWLDMSVGMAGVPDWIPAVEAAGVAVKVLPTDEFFPHMAQAVAASEIDALQHVLQQANAMIAELRAADIPF